MARVQERTFIIGPHGGKADTIHVPNFTDHISDIFDFPDADIPIPYTELLITAIPGYKKRPKREGVSPQLLPLPVTCPLCCPELCTWELQLPISGLQVGHAAHGLLHAA